MLVSDVQHSDSQIYVCVYIFFFRFFFFIGYYKILGVVSCAIQYDLVGYLILCTVVGIYVNPYLPIYAPSSLVTASLFSMSAGLFLFCI